MVITILIFGTLVLNGINRVLEMKLIPLKNIADEYDCPGTLVPVVDETSSGAFVRTEERDAWDAMPAVDRKRLMNIGVNTGEMYRQMVQEGER